MTLLADLHDKVRSILKAAGEKKAVVPTDPGDPDELQPDYRVGKSSPTDADVKDAKEDGEDAQDGEGDGACEKCGGKGCDECKEEAPAPEPNKEDSEQPEGLEEQPEKGRPVEKGFDEFGNKDLSDEEVREVLKSYADAPNFGIETNPIPQDDLLEGGVDLKKVLDDVMALILHQQEKLDNYSSVMDDLRAELARMKKGMGKNEREIAKAMDLLGDPKTAPGMPPRAVVKALIPAAPAAPAAPCGADLANTLFADLKAGRISQTQAQAMCREARA